MRNVIANILRFFLFIPGFVYAQNEIIELQEAVKNATDDSTKIVSTLDLAFYYVNRNGDSSIYYCDKATRLAKDRDYPLEVANSKNIKAMAFQSLGDYASAIIATNEAIEIAKQLIKKEPDKLIYKNRLFKFYNTLGNTYYYLSDYPSAIQYYILAIRNAEKTDSDIVSLLYSNMGMVYKEFKDYSMGIKYLKKAIERARKKKQESIETMAVVNLGSLFFDAQKYDSASYYYSQILPKIETESNPDISISVYLNLAAIYNENSDFELSMHYLTKAKALIDKYDYERSRIYYFKSIAKLYEKKEQLDKSIAYLKKAYHLADSLGEKSNLQNTLELLCFNYSEKEDYRNAFIYSLKLLQVKDSIFTENNASTIRELEIKFDVDRKRLQIEKLKAKQKADQQQKALLWVSVFALLAITLLVVLAFIQKRKRMEVKREKSQEKMRFLNRQLASQALTMMQKNKLLLELQKSIVELGKEKPENISKSINRIKHQIKRNINSEKDWEVFKMYFEQLNKSFFKALKKINPDLTDHDLKIAALIKLKLNIKEVASLLNLSPNSVKGSRYRLRKKLNLSLHDDLSDFIGKID
jgi:tetratricopeptide (TPR) repeat protein